MNSLANKKLTIIGGLVGGAALLGGVVWGLATYQHYRKYHIRFRRVGDEGSKLFEKEDLIKILKELRQMCKNDIKSVTHLYREKRRAVMENSIEYQQMIEKMYSKIEKVFSKHLIQLIKDYRISQTLLERSVDAY